MARTTLRFKPRRHPEHVVDLDKGDGLDGCRVPGDAVTVTAHVDAGVDELVSAEPPVCVGINQDCSSVPCCPGVTPVVCQGARCCQPAGVACFTGSLCCSHVRTAGTCQ